MRYNNSFILIVLISVIFGALFAIFTDNSKINQKPIGRNNLKKKNATLETTNITKITNITNTNKTDSNNKSNTTNINNKSNTTDTKNITNTTNIKNITDEDINKNNNPSKKNYSGIINILDDEDDEEEDDNDNIRKPVLIAISIDNKYTLPALVFLTSLMENIGDKTKYEIYIMTADDYSESNKKKFFTLIKKYGKEKLKIAFLNMKDNYVPTTYGPYISKAAYYRVYLPYLLPKVKKLIYLDVDMINFHDLSEFYNMELKKDIYLYAMADYYDHRRELFRYGITTDKYINSGTLLMDLKNIRKNGFDEKLKQFMIKHGRSLNHHDQTAINAVYYKNMGILPIKYVIFSFKKFEDLVKYNNEQEKPYRSTMEQLKEAYTRPFLIHYAGYSKPWQKKDVAFKEHWWYYAKKSDFYDEILRAYSFSENEVNNILKMLKKK